eukprot:COSAG02_NODE_751_length_17653_cov_172.765011_2_plen_234_part_00
MIEYVHFWRHSHSCHTHAQSPLPALTNYRCSHRINNGWNQGGPKTATGVLPNNTLSLPRELSATVSGQLRQRFVPELQKLRQKHTHVADQLLPSGGMAAAKSVDGAAGLQLEIMATFKVPTGGVSCKFGLLVLAAADKSEYTAITFDPRREHVLLDRTRSGASINADIRGGPWPQPSGAEISVHIYVDHAIVELIAFSNSTTGVVTEPELKAVESTAIAAWVQCVATATIVLY